MNSQFKNSSLGTYIYAFLILIMTAAVVFIFWYMYSGYKMGTYAENTVLGSVYVGGLREDDVDPLMNTRIDRWLGDETVLFEATYQGYSYEFDRELFIFNINDSKLSIQPGIINQLKVTYTTENETTIINELKDLEFLQDVENNIDYEKLISDILYDASLMKSLSSHELEDYLLTEDNIIALGVSDIIVPSGINVDDIIDGVIEKYGSNRILLKDQYKFDVEVELGDVLPDAELTILSLGIFDLIQETNFSINEVHYENEITGSYTVADFPYFGRNVKIFEISNESFSFYNPNDGYYYFEVMKADGKLRVVLHGLPFVNDIVIDDSRIFTIPFAIRESEDPSDVAAGVLGVDVTIYRIITDIYGNIIYNNIIVKEFYPPEVEINLKP